MAGITVIATRVGFIHEEIAAKLSGLGTVQFDVTPFDEHGELGDDMKDVERFIVLNERYYTGEDPRVVRYKSANEFVNKELDGNWGAFSGYEEVGSNAYYACHAIKTIDVAARLDAINACIRGGDDEVRRHAVKGRAFEEKGKSIARIAAEHSVYDPTERVAVTSLGMTCEINLTHLALRTRHFGTRLTVVHYIRCVPTLVQKWSIRAPLEHRDKVEKLMMGLCGEGNFGGSVGGMIGVPEGTEWYQAGGTSRCTFDTLISQMI